MRGRGDAPLTPGGRPARGCVHGLACAPFYSGTPRLREHPKCPRRLSEPPAPPHRRAVVIDREKRGEKAGKARGKTGKAPGADNQYYRFIGDARIPPKLRPGRGCASVGLGGGSADTNPMSFACLLMTGSSLRTCVRSALGWDGRPARHGIIKTQSLFWAAPKRRAGRPSHLFTHLLSARRHGGRGGRRGSSQIAPMMRIRRHKTAQKRTEGFHLLLSVPFYGENTATKSVRFEARRTFLSAFSAPPRSPRFFNLSDRVSHEKYLRSV